jgi:hypothetical protein
MTPQRRNATLLIALLAALASVPLPWVTQRQTHAQQIGTVTDGLTGNVIYQPVTYTYTHVTGINGFLQFGLTVPLWIVSSMICVSCIGQLLGRSAFFEFSPKTLRLMAFVSLLLTALVGMLGITGLLSPNGGYPNTGLLLAFLSGLVATRPNVNDSSAESNGEQSDATEDAS